MAGNVSRERECSPAIQGSHLATATIAKRGRLGAYLELTKPRVTFLVLLTTAAGFYLASPALPDFLLLVHALLGTGLVAAGTAVLNQFLEREADSRMQRTGQRPLPSGRLEARSALRFGVLLVVLGTVYLHLFANFFTALLCALTCIVYLFVYTPLKTRTVWCTLVGAFPGAAPPLIGWAAVKGALDVHAWALFAIVFLWQVPHFLAISWLYREDYQRGGFTMLPVMDSEGRRTARSIVIYSLVLLPVSILPWISGLLGPAYLFGAIALGIILLAFGMEVAWARSKVSARRLLRASVVYLPLLLILMVVDKAVLQR